VKVYWLICWSYPQNQHTGINITSTFRLDYSSLHQEKRPEAMPNEGGGDSLDLYEYLNITRYAMLGHPIKHVQ
jgi:hypothetical protein